MKQTHINSEDKAVTDGSFRRVKALVIKEFYQIIRDPSTFLISFILPAILLFIYGYGVSLTITNLRIGLYAEDTSPEAVSFVQSLTSSPYFEVSIGQSREELKDQLMRGNIRGIIIIPEYFSRFRSGQEQLAPIQVISDGSEPNTARFVQNYIQGAWLSWMNSENILGHEGGKALVTIDPRYWYNEELESRNFLLPGSLGIIMTLVGTLLTALVVARDWERGVMEVLLSMPLSIMEMMIGKLLPYFILGMIAMSASIFAIVFIFGVPLRGSLLLLELVSATFLVSALALGLLISILTKNQFVAAQASLVAAFLPGFMLSGFLFEISSMPWPIQALTTILPVRYFVSSLQTIFLVGNIWPLILFDMFMILMISAFLFFIIARVTVRRLD